MTSFVSALSLACAGQFFLKAALVLICTSLSLRVYFCSGATEGNVRTCVDSFVLHGCADFLQLVALVKHIQWLTHHHAADFRRRVTEVLQQFHYTLLLICRRSSRIKLIDMPFSNFTLSVLRWLFRTLVRSIASSLAHARVDERAHGRLFPLALFVILETCVTHMPSDTQKLESFQ